MNISNSSNINYSYNDNKRLYITGGLALGSLLVYGGLWLMKKFKRVTLNKWFDEYLNELKEMKKEIDAKKQNKTTTNSNSKEEDLSKSIPINFIAFSMNLSSELQSYLFNKENHLLEEERIKNLKNEKEYEELVTDTVEKHEAYYEVACSIIKSKTGVDIDSVKHMLNSVDQRELKEALESQRKEYYESDLPLIEKDKLREAYIYYAKTYSQHSRIAAEQMAIMQKRPEYQEVGFKTIFQNKFLLKDMIKQKYNVDTKYLDQLIKVHNLLNDDEVAYYYEMNKNTVKM